MKGCSGRLCAHSEVRRGINLTSTLVGRQKTHRNSDSEFMTFVLLENHFTHISLLCLISEYENVEKVTEQTLIQILSKMSCW